LSPAIKLLLLLAQLLPQNTDVVTAIRFVDAARSTKLGFKVWDTVLNSGMINISKAKLKININLIQRLTSNLFLVPWFLHFLHILVGSSEDLTKISLM